MAYYELDLPLAAHAERSERAAFIRRTYAHLAGAVLAFAGVLGAIFTLVPKQELDQFMLTAFRSRLGWLVVLAAFIGVGYLARWWAHASTSRGVQYLGLALYVVAEAVIFVPLMWMAAYHSGDPTIIPTAGILTLCVFGGLTMAVFTTGKDFSFLGPVLSVAGFLLLGTIIAAMLFNFTLGLVFCFLVVGLASAYILYNTSNVLHHYRTDQHVGAALELFASLALLFWYILQILLLSRND
jgi:FtsH-binding integral membrane protein